MTSNSILVEARNATTPATRLAQIAHENPETRVAIAGNPSAYQGLLNWLAELHDPEVDEALRRRHEATDPGATIPPIAVAVPDAPVPAFDVAPPVVTVDSGAPETTGWQKAGAALDTAGNVVNGVASVVTKIYGLGLILVAIIAVCLNPAALIWPALLLGAYGVYLVLPGSKLVIY